MRLCYSENNQGHQLEVVPCSKKQRDAEFEPEDLTWHFIYLKLEEA